VRERTDALATAPRRAEDVSTADTICYGRALREEIMAVLSLHDILLAWQAGKMDYLSAMELAQIDTIGELYKAAEHSGVEIRTEPNEHELQQAEMVAELIRGQAKLQAA
jgi:hypothetical protein